MARLPTANLYFFATRQAHLTESTLQPPVGARMDSYDLGTPTRPTLCLVND
ncbi:hypothetical protein MES5069_520020 [Mesorhizobium escarrei]|uniref:Uncharacterized protein n=1 Tax=Mesorhizobium escarrei TaxID=666018 RepID=A0ABN8K7J0_9HYPH|nr:hypothetical protein MES5069_520020 [Mesorhizobium escarrei]